MLELGNTDVCLTITLMDYDETIISIEINLDTPGQLIWRNAT